MKKGDSHTVLSVGAVESLIKQVKAEQGDIYDKATLLMVGLIRSHPFGSGNRRTAYAATKAFLESNGEEFRVKVDPKVMQGIREGFYSREEIKSWLKGNEIREFKRRKSVRHFYMLRNTHGLC